jgi:hypothetical protein
MHIYATKNAHIFDIYRRTFVRFYGARCSVLGNRYTVSRLTQHRAPSTEYQT